MRRPPLSAVVLASVVLAAPGCRPGTALGNRYNNFRAFYNTYYNASQSLEQGEEALQNDAATVDRSQLVRVFPVTGGGGGGPFEDAVEKSAELLRNRPTSKWADDALLLIGKAYFYQRNFAGAEQKFQETAAAAQTTGDLRLGDEAQFWLGRTYAATERYDEGVEVLQDGLAREDVDRRWRSRMRLALGELYALAGRWDEAAGVLREGAPEVGDGDLAARAYVLLGQVEEYAGRYDEAAAAYTAALDERPAFELAYAAAVNRALVVGLDGGDTDQALEFVGRMRGDDKFYERRGELALVRGRLLEAAGRTAEARVQFLDVLYDPELDGQRVRGEAHYRLGEFYRDALGDYVRASAHFDTAATALREPPAEVSASRAAVLGVPQQARTYAALAETARRVEEADSLLALGALSDEAFAARIEAIEAERLRVYQEQQRRLDAERAAQAFSGEGVRFEDDPDAPPRPNAGLQAPVGGADAGFLSYRDPNTVQAGLVAFEQRWGSRPLVPDWRRSAAISASGVTSDVGGVGDDARRLSASLGSGLPRLDVSRVPRTPDKREELNTQLAQLRYELANAFFLSLGRADTAAALYRQILDDTPDLPAAVRARYALAEIERAAGREGVARPLYEEVVAAAPDGDLARASRTRLGTDVDRPAPPEATAETSAAYDAARARWRGGAALEAAAAFVALGDADPDSAQAARAYLAAAAAYAEWAGGDSLALAGPLPDSLVSAVLARVPRAEPQDEAGLAPEPFASPPNAPDDSAAEGGAVAPPLPRPQRRAADSLNVPAYVTALGDEDPASDSLAAAPDTEVTAEPPPGIEPGGADETPVVAAPAPIRLPGEAAAPPDSAAFTLRDHLGAVAALYPGTVYADRARALEAVLPAPLARAPTDADTAAADPFAALRPSAAGEDTSGVAQPPVGAPPTPPADSLETDEAQRAGAPDEPALAENAEEEPFPQLRGSEPVDPSEGGVTWRLRTLSIPTEGDALVRGLRRGGFRTAVVTDGTAYYVVVGQFETADEAEAAREALPLWAQARAEVVSLSDFSVAPRPGGEAGDFRP